MYKYQLCYHLKQLAEQHFRSGPGGSVDLGTFTLSIRPSGSLITETVTASIGIVSSLDDILSTPLRLSSGLEVNISHFTGGRDNVTRKYRQWHIFSLLRHVFGDNKCLPNIVSLSHLSNASIFTDNVIVTMFSELLADAEILTGGEIPVTTAAIKTAAIRIRQQGASTSATVSATDTVTVTDSVTVTDTDDIEEHIQLLQQQHQQQQQRISQYLQEIQDLREQLGLLQLQMIPDVLPGNTIYSNN